MWFLGLFGFIVVIGIWYVVSYSQIFSEFLVPPPHDVFETFFVLFATDNMAGDAGITLYRTLISYVISAAIGIPLGTMLGYSKKLYYLFQPIIDFFRSIPAPALFPVFLLLLGFGDVSKIAVAVFAGGFIITINSMYGVHNVNKSRVLLAKTMKATSLQIYKKVVFYDSLPYVFVGLRQVISISLILIVITEMFFGSNDGLGFKIFNYHSLYEIESMYATIIMTGIIGYVLNIVFLRFEKKIVHWTGK